MRHYTSGGCKFHFLTRLENPLAGNSRRKKEAINSESLTGHLESLRRPVTPSLRIVMSLPGFLSDPPGNTEAQANVAVFRFRRIPERIKVAVCATTMVNTCADVPIDCPPPTCGGRPSKGIESGQVQQDLGDQQESCIFSNVGSGAKQKCIFAS